MVSSCLKWPSGGHSSTFSVLERAGSAEGVEVLEWFALDKRSSSRDSSFPGIRSWNSAG